MKALVATLAVSSLLAAGLFASPARAAASCVAPEPVFAYDTEEIAYTVAVDLSGCSWLGRKQSFEIRGSLDRAGGVSSQGETGVASCLRRAGTCRLLLGMAHLPAEVAQYTGEISYVWKGKRKVFPLAKTCASAVLQAACLDG